MRARGSIAGPLLLIVIGIVFLIHAISPSFEIAAVFAQYWPYLLIAWGGIELLEISIRFMAGSAIPVNGISGGGWLVVILICVAGLASFEVRRPDSWWRHAGFERGVEAFGQEHEYGVNPIERPVGKAPHIVLETFRGDAKIAGTGGHQLTLTGHKTIRAFEPREADTANTLTPVQVVSRGNTIIIRCNQDKANGQTPVTTNLDLVVPKDASIEAVGTTGDFDISGLSGDINLSSGNAGVRVQDIEGNVLVDTRASDLIRCANVKGDVDLRGRGTDVELTNVTGHTTLAGEYTGTVSLGELAQTVRIENMRTKLEAEQVPGKITLDNGSLNMQNVMGPVKVATHATDVVLDGFTDGLELTVDKGDIDLRPGRLPLSAILVHTKSGNIELSLPQAALFALTASTKHGDINNEFGDVLREQTQGRGARLQGSVGDGPELKLVTNRGTITVRKVSGASEPPKVSAGRLDSVTQQARLQ